MSYSNSVLDDENTTDERDLEAWADGEDTEEELITGDGA